MYYIGVDLGTTGVKLVLLDEQEGIVKSVTKNYPIAYPHPGWSEQHPKDWWQAVIDGLKELISCIDAKAVDGISFGGQMHGLVILDEHDEVIRPAILWNDGRTEAETAYLNQEIGKNQLRDWTANIAFAGFTAPKLLWLREHEPQHFQRIQKMMLPKDYIAYKLSGVHATDVSDASGMLLLDVANRTWSQQMLTICHVHESMLPKLYESYEVIGEVLPSVAKEIGLPEHVKVVAGAGDNAAAAIGTGTVGEGDCNISLGTSGTIFISSKTFRMDEQNALHSFCHANGQYHLMGCMLSAASGFHWWSEDILKETDYDALQNQIHTLGENPVFYLPYPMGERSPHNDPMARAAFIGMSLDTTQEDMTQAVMEGVSFGLRDSLEVAVEQGIHITKTNICGGGAKSLIWKKMIANIMDLCVETQETDEGAGMGAAILAAVGCGAFSDVPEAKKRFVKTKETIEPEPLLVARYEERYQKFRDLYPRLREWYRR